MLMIFPKLFALLDALGDVGEHVPRHVEADQLAQTGQGGRQHADLIVLESEMAEAVAVEQRPRQVPSQRRTINQQFHA